MSLALPNTPVFLPHPPTRYFPSRHCHRRWKRRRLTPPVVCCQLNQSPSSSSFNELFYTLISQFPSVNSLNYIAPTLGIASGFALFLSSRFPKLTVSSPNSDFDIGEWILFTSPTPFNRFVTLRCPSTSFPGNEFLEDVNEKLVNEDRHYVKLSSGRMCQVLKGENDVDEKLVYQRICVVTEDGGVLSLDWPANLDLEEERGMDTTVLVVPGTAAGSDERKIRVFVSECLRRGVFPVVMNPRGCAGSPLTNARLFTAADSDDISTAVQFINKKRPWTTLMGVGWEYGANMLTKYLAECGERTPLTAATCIDNPFDLEEVTRSSMHHLDFDRRHIDGFIKILQSNKELFQGQGKGFDVERALSASSIRDFDTAISMVSYGYGAIEEFYENCSTREVIGKVKVPVLFIQNDDSQVPMFSIPRGLIAENPYTSLLLCSYASPIKTMDDLLMFSWCQHLTLEWLSAVELGLLKGHHPLLDDVDVTVNPSKGLTLVETRSSKGEKVNEILNLSTNGNFPISPVGVFQRNDADLIIQGRSTKGVGKPPPLPKGVYKGDNNVGKEFITSMDAVAEGPNSSDNERGQVLLTAEVVMNMLDMTMPGVLSDEQKMKVLNAVDQGETLMKALQDAVPEDVRGKLTASVSGILQNHGSNIKLNELLNLGRITDVASGFNSKAFEKTRQTKENANEDVPLLDQNKRINDPKDGSSKIVHSSERSPGGVVLETQSAEMSEKPNGSGANQSASNNGSSIADLETEKVNDMGYSAKEQVLGANEEVPIVSEGLEEIVIDQKRRERSGKGESNSTEVNNQNKIDLPPDQNKVPEAYHTDDKNSAPSVTSETQVNENELENNRKNETSPLPPFETQVNENEADNNQKKGDTSSFSVPSENNSNSGGRFSVAEALDALTGFDDSTQIAVNSVFNVIEGMIDQLDVEKNKENDINEGNGIDDVNGGRSAQENHHIENSFKSGPNTDLKNNESAEYDKQQRRECGKDDRTRRFLPVNGEYLAGNPDVQTCLTTFPYEDPLYKEYLKMYLNWKMRRVKPQSVNKMSALYLDYIPEEGQWKLLEQTDNDSANATHEGDCKEDLTNAHQSSNIVEPSYVILDSSTPQDQNKPSEEMNNSNNGVENDNIKSEDSMLFIRSLLLECLNVEVGRRASNAKLEELQGKLACEIEYIANTVSVEAVEDNIVISKGNDNPQKLVTLDGKKIMKVISSAFQDTQYLRKILPVGVVVGSILAALGNYFHIVALDGSSDDENAALDEVGISTEKPVQVDERESCERLLKNVENKDNITSSVGQKGVSVDLQNSNNKELMVGAVTAALGASALLVHQQNTNSDAASSEHLFDRGNCKDPSNIDDMPEKMQNNIVTSLAEKALSVASPVVPVKEDGKVDQERLVSMLAELGQKGGILKLVGKVALLWGGIRGAMSLTDKLISFLRIADRPLFQRILSFVSMVLLLWSPVVIPLLPTLLQNWAANNNPLKIAELACIAGLYVSILIMITLWGKRIRKYDDPLQQYGLDFAPVSQWQNFLKGLVGGFILIVLIHTVNASFGFANLSWPITLSSSSSKPIAVITSYTHMFMAIVQGIATASAVSVVEELLFRSWLPQEIAADFGYHRGIVISGLVFAVSQRSLWEIPGLWLLSLSLSGARERSQGSLSLPVGLRTGILFSNLMLRSGGFLSYRPNCPMWVTGGHPFQPFSGAVGVALSLALAVILYPRQPFYGKKTARLIRE